MPILLFDGQCNLCNATVQWVLRRDKKAVFTFASLQSDVGKELLQQHGLLDIQLDSVVLVTEQRAYIHSDAPLVGARYLGFPYRMLYLLKSVPRFFRDSVYRWIAANRYRWFGKKEACMLPQPEWEHRFL